MKKSVLIITIATVILSVACNSKGGNYISSKPTKDIDSVSYIIGVLMGKNLRSSFDSSTINLDYIAKGIYDELNSKKPFFEVDEASGMKIQAYLESKSKVKSDAFFAELSKNKNIKKTASGLMYEVIKEGNGPKPTDTSIVKVHYTGTLIGGKVFDSSVERGEPVTFPLNGVIPGWTEGLQLMPVGSKYKFYIPGELAYGPQGMPQAGIGPNETLIFEVELLSIEKEMPKQEAQPQMSNEDLQRMIEEAAKKQGK
ncbi:MAG: FKBP-type peptidyl-prolyl cis-trans isomerase [Chitinophagales bacterium]|nr:FKBP-type peptidyl-prolyl cis-trans isomerase [Bacteroidota bacterium]